MKTLKYSIRVGTSSLSAKLSHNVHIRKSEINYDKMEILEILSDDPDKSEFGWGNEISTSQEYGSVNVPNEMFVLDGARISGTGCYNIPVRERTTWLGDSDVIESVSILSRKNGYIDSFVTYKKDDKSKFSYTGMTEYATEFLDDDDFVKAYNKNRKIFIPKPETYTRHVVIDKTAIPRQELKNSNNKELCQIEKDRNKTIAYTEFLNISEYEFFDSSNTKITPEKEDSYGGIFVLNGNYDEVYAEYKVSPVVQVSGKPIYYANKVNPAAEINLFQLSSPDIRTETVSAVEDISIDNGSTTSELLIYAPEYRESIFIEPDANIFINGDLVKAGDKYEISNQGTNSLTISAPASAIDLLTAVPNTAGKYELTGYIQGTLAAIYGEFRDGDTSSIQHISFNKKSEKLSDYLSGTLNMSNSGLYTVRQTGPGLDITFNTDTAGMSLALPALSTKEAIAVYKEAYGVMAEYDKWEYAIPGIVTVSESGVYKVSYTPIISPDETTIRITDKKLQQSFIDKLSVFRDNLVNLYSIHSRIVNLKIGYITNDSVSYSDKNISFNLNISPSAIRRMVSESKNIIL